MQTVAILTTSHNQREQLLSVLESVYIQIDQMKNEETYSFSVYLLDDDSTDGTVSAVFSKFPQVRIAQGDASGQWHHGFQKIWEIAAKESPDFYLLVDPHLNLNPGAIACLMENSRFLKHRALIAGTVSDPSGATCLYGGMNKHGKILTPDDVLPIPCTTFDGQLLLVPRYVYDTIGQLNPIFQMKFADNEYGARARKNGIALVVAPRILARYHSEETLPVWRDAAYSVKTRFRAVRSPEGCPPRERFLFDLRNSGLLCAIGNNISIWLKVLFPRRK